MRKLLQNALTRRLLVVVCATLLMLGITATASAVPTAHASIKGQQVGIYCDPTSQHPVDQIVISGPNQDNHQSVFNGVPSDAGSGWVVWNWWWQGSVTVYWHEPGKGWFTVTDNVPAGGTGLYSIAQCV